MLKLPTIPAPAPSTTATPDSAPPHARRNHRHATWARTFHSRPEYWIQPRSTEEVQRLVVHARARRRRVTTVGSGHSPSDLTCTSSWMVNLDGLASVLEVRKYDDSSSPPAEKQAAPRRYAGRALVQAGISLRGLNDEMARHGLTLPNLGSIDVQSVAGAIATATHGSSLRHGILSTNVRGLRIVLASGEARWCSAAAREHPDLFRAALVSLGALGVVTEVEIELAAACNIAWETRSVPLADALARWDTGLWDRDEFVRCWWMPYTRRLVVWSGSKTTAPCRAPDRRSSYAGWLGYHLYQAMLLLANHIPSLVPVVERLVMGMEHGSSATTTGRSNAGVDEQRSALLMDCLYSQFVNEWAIPLHRGPEALRRLEAWLLGPDDPAGDIPFSNAGLYAHAPVEVRVGGGGPGAPSQQPRALLDQSRPDGPTLYLNATLYRPYGSAPPWADRYYEGFEWLMRELGGRPHWAKNFGRGARRPDFQRMYGGDLDRWLEVRSEVDPLGLFVGEWHRRNLLGSEAETLRLEMEEGVVEERARVVGGGFDWVGAPAVRVDG